MTPHPECEEVDPASVVGAAEHFRDGHAFEAHHQPPSTPPPNTPPPSLQARGLVTYHLLAAWVVPPRDPPPPLGWFRCGSFGASLAPFGFVALLTLAAREAGKAPRVTAKSNTQPTAAKEWGGALNARNIRSSLNCDAKLYPFPPKSIQFSCQSVTIRLKQKHGLHLR